MGLLPDLPWLFRVQPFHRLGSGAGQANLSAWRVQRRAFEKASAQGVASLPVGTDLALAVCLAAVVSFVCVRYTLILLLALKGLDHHPHHTGEDTEHSLRVITRKDTHTAKRGQH